MTEAERERVVEPFRFRRFVGGQEMAEDIQIERETTLDAAMLKAVRLCPRAKQPTVLVVVLANGAEGAGR